jgi:hypothetical protein
MEPGWDRVVRVGSDMRNTSEKKKMMELLPDI